MKINKMKYTLVVICVLFAGIKISFGQTFNTDAILGMWLTGTGKAAVTIYKDGNKYFGKITWLKNPLDEGKPRIDKNNPDEKKKTDPLMGANILKEFIFAGGDKWEKGTIYDPENGKTYSCKITMVNESKLDVRGFVGISMLGRTQVWIRIPDKK
ncbi:MAG TPA: DUF2147 domain-containing protein [Bacteroidia bacterium]|jgi:uncharacterized protein (DUF2147 family)|nr:DUF2147 domain-containing protein [Bacteroidia bacterium]